MVLLLGYDGGRPVRSLSIAVLVLDLYLFAIEQYTIYIHTSYVLYGHRALQLPQLVY